MLTAVRLNVTVLWDVLPCGLVGAVSCLTIGRVRNVGTVTREHGVSTIES